jgi:DNA-directed RNA polymerase subunit RPC12/RpoP
MTTPLVRITTYFWGCGLTALVNRWSILDHSLNQLRVGTSIMCLDAGAVLKRYVLCPHCRENYLFTLRGIANNPELRCHRCGGRIRLCDRVYEPLVSGVRNTLSEIDFVQSLSSLRVPSLAV